MDVDLVPSVDSCVYPPAFYKITKYTLAGCTDCCKFRGDTLEEN